jgi:SnoaL-like protein
MKSQQELSDRLELQDLITAYSYAIDFHRFDDLDDVFTPDATVDLTATGGIRGTLPEVKEWLGTVLPSFGGHQHLVATSQVTLDGDTATARTICHNPMWFTDAADGPMCVGLWYLDSFARTPAGWRITARVQQKGFMARWAPLAH